MAKRQIVADQPKQIRSPNAPKAQERELERFASYMIDQMEQRWRNQVFGELNKSTINKFADAQIGNYAAVYLKLANRVRRKLLRQFDDKRIEQLVRDIMSKVNQRNRSQLYELVEKRIGIPTTELTNTEGLMADINALVLETTQWVKDLRDETLRDYTNHSLQAMTQGKSLSEVLVRFDGLVEKRKNHAAFVARNQIANFNSITTKLRAQNLGITKARWVTSRDERVRASHKERNGKEFDLAEGLYSSVDGKTLLPGVDYQCRCTYELIIPVDDEVSND